MLTYLVKISMNTNKIVVIKLIRAITGWGLKQSKEFVETNFDFNSYSDTLEFEVTLGAEQYAALTHFVITRERFHTQRGEILFLDSNVEVPRLVNPFDFTCT